MSPPQPTERQLKIRDLLKSETQKYMEEIALRAAPETSEARSERLKQKELEAKAREEQERQALCEEKLKQKFLLENDEIRAENSKLIQIETAGFQLEQIREKQESRKKDTADLQVYEFLNQQSYSNKIAREQMEHELRESRMSLMKHALDEQVRLKKEKEKKLTENITVTDEGFLSKLGQRSNRLPSCVTIQSHSELVERQRREKQDRILAEKEESQKIVQELVKREKEIAEEERLGKLKQAHFLRSFIEQHREDSVVRRQLESQLEKELLAESEAAWKEREYAQIQEELKRQNLLAQVMEERNAQVLAKESKILSRKSAIQDDRVQVEIQTVKELEQIDAEKKQRRLKQLEYARDLEQQVRSKKRADGDITTLDRNQETPCEMITLLKQKQKEVYNRMISPYCEQFD